MNYVQSAELVAMATEMLNLQEFIKKSSPLKPHGRWSWNFAEMFTTVASTEIVLLLPFLMC